MSNVWTLEEEDQENNEKHISVWTTSQAAQKEAVAKIQDRIQQYWDLSDPDIRDWARQVNDAVASGDYMRAIPLYNDEEGNKDYPYYISVGTKLFHDYSDASEPEIFNYDDDEDDEEPVSSGPFVATSPGAVCRGPCHTHSPDAYADRRDGTYECYQCKLMKSVFGS